MAYCNMDSNTAILKLKFSTALLSRDYSMKEEQIVKLLSIVNSHKLSAGPDSKEAGNIVMNIHSFWYLTDQMASTQLFSIYCVTDWIASF